MTALPKPGPLARLRPATALRHGLAGRLVLWLVGFGVLVTLLQSGSELFVRYRQDLAQIERNLQHITDHQRLALEAAVWALDDEQVSTQLDGIHRLPDIEYVAVIVNGKVRWERGTAVSQRRIERVVAMTRQVGRQEEYIGQLKLVASVDRVIERRLGELAGIGLDSGLWITAVALFLMLLFHGLVTRHLNAMAAYLRSVGGAQLPEHRLQLRRPPRPREARDELDQIVAAVNTMISDLRRTQAETEEATRRLSEREAYLSAVFSQAGRAIVVIDRDTLRIVDVNAAACRMLGYSREEYLNLSLIDCQAEHSERRLRELVHQVGESGRSFATRYRRKDGSLIEVDLDARVMRIGERRLLVDIWSDVTLQRHMERELAATRDDLRTILDCAAEGVWTTDENGRYLYANPAACAISGHHLSQLLELSIPDLLDESDLQRVSVCFERMRASPDVVREEWTMRRLDGSRVPVELATQRLPDGRFLAVGRDISERRASEEGLRRAAGVFSNSVEGIMITDPEGAIIDVNPAFTRITGYSAEEVLGRNPSLLRSDRHGPDFFSTMWRTLAERGHWRGEVWNRKKSGEVFAELLSISAIKDGAGKTVEYVAVFSDISRLKAHEAELDRIAHYDPLTGLPNRRLLDDRLRLARARADREGSLLALCFLDLDGFKPINDAFGHAAGDEFLTQIAKRLQGTLRGGDTLARLGGDEFVLLLGDLRTVEETAPVLDRVLKLVAQPVEVHGREISVSASIGVTLYPRDNVESDALLRHADQAMYQAKQLGKSRAHLFDAEHDRRVAAHREALAELRHALRRNEFMMYFQPKIDLRSGEVLGAEALLRWRKPDGRVVAPGEFLPVIEGSPLELELSAWVIEAVLAQIAAWKQAGLPCRVSANLVAAHLQARDFMEWLDQLLACYPLVGRGELSLEILESAAIGDLDTVAKRLEQARALGVGLALDDFGTGYSSLAYLRRLPVDTLKVDQTFVRDMLADREAHGIVDSVVRLSDVFGRHVVAEGIETLDHWRALLALGCTSGQGYGIARPMPASEFPEWVTRWRREQIWREVTSG